MDPNAAVDLQQQIYSVGAWSVSIMFSMMVIIGIWEIIANLTNKKITPRYILDSVTSIITVPAISLMGTAMTIVGFGSVYVIGEMLYNNYAVSQMGWTWGSFALALLLTDLWYYWTHRGFHRVNVMWITHTVHHSSDYINIPMAVRFGPLDGFFMTLSHLPLSLILDPAMVVLCIGINQTFQGVMHTDRIGKLPAWIETIFNTPSNHRVHHGSNPQYIDKNYAGILMCWDKMFGTYEPEVEQVFYGITKPLKYQDPISVLFHGYWRFAQKLTTVRSPKELAFSFLGSPGWQTKKEITNHVPLEGLTKDEFERNRSNRHSRVAQASAST